MKWLAVGEEGLSDKQTRGPQGHGSIAAPSFFTAKTAIAVWVKLALSRDP